MRSLGNALLQRWHRMLGLSRQSPPSWYRDRLHEELRERRIARTPWQKLSETSDVFFSISRAQYDGFPVRKLPPFVTSRHIFVYAYMLAKFTSRWKFYRTAAIRCNAPHYDLVREVVNPSKDQSLKRWLHVTRLTQRNSKELVDNCDKYGLFRRDVISTIAAQPQKRNREDTKATANGLREIPRSCVTSAQSSPYALAFALAFTASVP